MPSLQSFSTFGLNAFCASIEPFTDVSSFLSLFDKHKTIYLLGGGSNTIFADDYDGTILLNQIKGISHYDTDEYHYLRVGAGENWHDFVSLCMQEQWYGLENLALIPGSVGACPIQNIGAYGREVKAFIDNVEVVFFETGEQVKINNDQCEFGYRDSIFKHALANKVLITHVNFKLPKNVRLETTYGELQTLQSPTPEAIYDKVVEIRKCKLPDPTQLGNAGSFFKNPIISRSHFEKIAKQYEVVPHFDVSDKNDDAIKVKIPAAWLIDQAGFKGKTQNGVRCHPTQPLVLTNIGGATGKDVISMAKSIIASVQEKFGVDLELEVRLLGNKGLISL